MSARDDGPAFPVPEPSGRLLPTGWNRGGMTLRDYFAGKALAGILANPAWLERGDFSLAAVAKPAWEYADAMLAARGES